MTDKQFVFGAIFILSNKLQETYKNLDGITLRQFMLINMLNRSEKQKLNLNELAVLLGCTRQNIKQIVNSLEKKDFLNIDKSRTDRREIEISLTAKSTLYLQNNEEAGNNILACLFENIDNKLIKSTSKLCKQLLENIDIIGEQNEI